MITFARQRFFAVQIGQVQKLCLDVIRAFAFDIENYDIISEAIHVIGMVCNFGYKFDQRVKVYQTRIVCVFSSENMSGISQFDNVDRPFVGVRVRPFFIRGQTFYHRMLVKVWKVRKM